MFNVHVYNTHKCYFKNTFSGNILYFLVISELAVFILSVYLFYWGGFLPLKPKWFESFSFFIINRLSLLKGLSTWMVTLEAS